MKKIALKIVGLLMLVSVAVVASFMWLEARDEIVFLCGNFKSGVTEESVIRQLDTGNLLRYKHESTTAGRRIEVDSAYNFGLYKCSIEFSDAGTVIHANVR